MILGCRGIFAFKVTKYMEILNLWIYEAFITQPATPMMPA